MKNILERFEQRAGLRPAGAAKVLGYAKSSYHHVKSSGKIPLPTERLVVLLLRMKDDQLQRIISEFSNDDTI